MGFIDVLKDRARANVKTIVLPETEDMRTLDATEKILKEGIAKVVLVGNEETVKKSAAEGGFDISGAEIVDPATSEKTQGYIDKLVELRQKKGMTPEQAKDILLNQYLYYGVMMVKMGDADGMVSGACHSTADTLRPCLQILKTKPGTNDEVVKIEDEAGTTSLYVARLAMDGLHAVSFAGAAPVQTWLPDFSTAGAVKKGEVEMNAAIALKASKAAGVFRGIKVK